jgi:hypothetical protein
VEISAKAAEEEIGALRQVKAEKMNNSPVHVFCMISIASLSGSKLTLLAPVKG